MNTGIYEYSFCIHAGHLYLCGRKTVMELVTNVNAYNVSLALASIANVIIPVANALTLHTYWTVNTPSISAGIGILIFIDILYRLSLLNWYFSEDEPSTGEAVEVLPEQAATDKCLAKVSTQESVAEAANEGNAKAEKGLDKAATESSLHTCTEADIQGPRVRAAISNQIRSISNSPMSQSTTNNRGSARVTTIPILRKNYTNPGIADTVTFESTLVEPTQPVELVSSS